MGSMEVLFGYLHLSTNTKNQPKVGYHSHGYYGKVNMPYAIIHRDFLISTGCRSISESQKQSMVLGFWAHLAPPLHVSAEA